MMISIFTARVNGGNPKVDTGPPRAIALLCVNAPVPDMPAMIRARGWRELRYKYYPSAGDTVICNSAPPGITVPTAGKLFPATSASYPAYLSGDAGQRCQILKVYILPQVTIFDAIFPSGAHNSHKPSQAPVIFGDKGRAAKRKHFQTFILGIQSFHVAQFFVRQHLTLRGREY
jgi:hypothetical protein